VLVVERIRAFNSSTLASDSKRKLQVGSDQGRL
jgi:hypothetical protein